MSEAGRPTHAWVWRAATIGLLGTLIGMVIMSGADAGSNQVSVLKPPKIVVEDGEVAGGNGNDAVTTAKCPKGWKVTGGGVDFQSGDPEVSVPYNGPLPRNDNLVAAGEGQHPGARKWRVRVENESVSGWTYSVGAICAKPVAVSK